MRAVAISIVLLLCIVCGVLADTKSDFLNGQNAARAAVKDASPSIPALTWSDTVARSAEEFAATCPQGHTGNSPYGENLAFGPKGYSVSSAVALWVAEKEFYNYPNCASGHTCGHYTQIIWAATTEVGCAVNDNCPNGSVFVCRYNPPGNYVNQTPYTQGSGGNDGGNNGGKSGGSKKGKKGKSGKSGKGKSGKKGKSN